MEDQDERLVEEAFETEKDLPRWVEVPAGIILSLFALVCAFASIVLLLDRYRYSPSPLLLVAVELILILGCFWVLEKSLRLVTGRKMQAGLMSPNALRAVAFVVLILPGVGLFTGYYSEHPVLGVFQAAMYVLGFFGLRNLARNREASLEETKKSIQVEDRPQ